MEAENVPIGIVLKDGKSVVVFLGLQVHLE